MATTIGSLDLNAFSDLYSDSTQYFWFESNASATYGAGAHVTLVPDTSFISNPTGQNILMNTDGFSIRNGLLPMMTLDNDSLDFNVVDTTAGTYTTTATFTATGAQIGQSSGAHSIIDADGQRFYASDGTTQLANIGYGEGEAQTGTTIAPYYTFGTRVSNSTVGNYSMAEGYGMTASGAYSHAEGYYTIASGKYSHAEGHFTIANMANSHAEGQSTTASGTDSHAEGLYTTASGDSSHAEGYHTTASGANSYAGGYYTTASGANSHAEGYYTTASGRYSHAEGYNTTASGDSSHAGGHYTIAQRKSQTVIGEYNIADEGGTDETTQGYYAFIIGNGYVDTKVHKSNALTVDWAGNVEAAGAVEAAGTLRAKTEQITPSVTTTRGTTVSSAVYRFGNVVTVHVAFRNTSSTAVGGFVYQATFANIPNPKGSVTTACYYGARCLAAQMSTSGIIYVRNTYSSAFAFEGSDYAGCSFTYVIN